MTFSLRIFFDFYKKVLDFIETIQITLILFKIGGDKMHQLKKIDLDEIWQK